MESKWPFILITFGLVFVLGLTIAGLERTGVMNNWESRRCDFPVMMAAMFFKPELDPRGSTRFAQDNFNFCMKSYIDKFMNLLMTPINILFGKQVNIVGSAVDIINTVRKLAATMYAEFSKYLTKFFGEFNRSVYEISRIIQYLRMAMQRANAMTMSMLYAGITMFRGMINTLQFIIKVILVICGIMLAIIIILIFVLFPFIPMILAVLGAIVATVLSMTMIMSGSLANEASSDQRGFCFSETSKIIVKENGTEKTKSVKDIKIGDELGNNCGKVTATILMSGKDVELYSINGIIVSGSHLVLGTDMLWKCVSTDKRAKKVDNTSNILYCFNTTTHNIPVFSTELQEINNPIMFRDWEEFDNNDQLGEYTWTYTILKMLNNNSNYNKWKDGLKLNMNMPLMGKNVKIKTNMGFVEISAISSLWSPNMSMCCLTRDNEEQDILGVVSAEIDGIEDDNGLWNTELYECVNGVWIKGLSTVKESTESKEIIISACGMTLITESGEFIIWDEIEQKEKIVRDFTEIGYKEIHKTYSLVSSRLRLLNQ
jgi:hypothetical protein